MPPNNPRDPRYNPNAYNTLQSIHTAPAFTPPQSLSKSGSHFSAPACLPVAPLRPTDTAVAAASRSPSTNTAAITARAPDGSHQRRRGPRNYPNAEFRCPICAKSFRWEKHIRSHVDVVHLKKKTHVCGCGMRFSTRANLAKHWRAKHSVGGKPVKGAHYECDECGETFQSKAKVVQHAVFFHV